MKPKDSLRVEAVYFAKLRDMIRKLEVMKETGNKPEELDTLIDSCIEANGAILVLYKNLGEAWNDCVSLIQEQGKKLEELKESVESYDDELNSKIDDINNYLNSQIGFLDARVTALENAPSGGGFTVLTMTVDDYEAQPPVYGLYNGEEKIEDYADLKALFDEGPVILFYYEMDNYVDPPALVMNYNMGFASLGSFLIPVEDPLQNRIVPVWVDGIYWNRIDPQDLSTTNPSYFSAIGYTVCYMSNASELGHVYMDSDF